MTVFPPTVEMPCTIHRQHRPVSLVTELHHVMPQGWQRTWAPDGDTDRLWHPETVALCPSGHRDVHRIIDALMHSVSDAAGVEGATARVRPTFGRLSEFPLAVRALALWEQAGGSFDLLIAHHEYGQV